MRPEGISPKYPHSISGDALSKSGRPRRIANRNEAAISDATAGEVYACFSAQCSDLSRISFGVDHLCQRHAAEPFANYVELHLQRHMMNRVRVHLLQ